MLTLEGPSIKQQHRCRSAESCVVTLEWPPDMVPRPGALAVAAKGVACGGEQDAGFIGGPTTGTDLFAWSKVAAVGGTRALCWCSLPDCTSPASFTHEVGLLEVDGPYAGHSFRCEVGAICDVAPVRGMGLSNGQALLYTSRDACMPRNATDEPEDEVGSSTLQGVVAQPAARCHEYYAGCTHVWDAQLMDVPVVLQGYRLCWCSSANCSRADFIVEIGILNVTGAE